MPRSGFAVVCICWALDDVRTFLWSLRDFREKNSSIFGEDLFFCSSLDTGKKILQYSVKTFFLWSSLNLLTWKRSWSMFIPPMLKIGQNWGKIANYPPPNAQQRSAPLPFGNSAYTPLWLSIPLELHIYPLAIRKLFFLSSSTVEVVGLRRLHLAISLLSGTTRWGLRGWISPPSLIMSFRKFRSNMQSFQHILDWFTEVESLRTSSRTHFEVFGLGL